MGMVGPHISYMGFVLTNKVVPCTYYHGTERATILLSVTKSTDSYYFWPHPQSRPQQTTPTKLLPLHLKLLEVALEEWEGNRTLGAGYTNDVVQNVRTTEPSIAGHAVDTTGKVNVKVLCHFE